MSGVTMVDQIVTPGYRVKIRQTRNLCFGNIKNRFHISLNRSINHYSYPWSYRHRENISCCQNGPNKVKNKKL